MSKSPDAFRTISEVAEDLDLPQHVLRFWETRFSQIKPMKRGGGRRYYRPEDVELLKGIRHLLYSEGYTIKGVQRILKEQGNKYVMAAANGTLPPLQPVGLVEEEKSKEAVGVGELVAGHEAKSKPGLLGRLAGTGKPANEAAATKPGAELSGDERQALQGALAEMLECKRLLDQVR